MKTIKYYNYTYNAYPVTTLIKQGSCYYLSSQSSNNTRTAYISRIDSSGTAIASDTLMDFDFINNSHRQMAGGPDGSIYIAGNFPPTHNKIRIVKYDSLLNRVWDRVIADSNASSIETMGLMYSPLDNALCIIGNKFIHAPATSIIIKLDSYGNILWETLADTLGSITDFEMDQAGNIILGGGHFYIGQDYDITLCKYTLNGNLQWFISIDGVNHGYDALYDLSIGFDNSINCAAFLTDTIEINAFRINSSGILQWVKPLRKSSYPRIVSDRSGSMYILSVPPGPSSAECFIYKIDSIGTTLRLDSVNVPGYIGLSGSFIPDLHCDDSANVYFIHNVIPGDQKWFFAKVDSSLQTKLAIVFDTVPGNAVPSSILLETNAFTIAGSVSNSPETRVMHFTENISIGVESIVYSPEFLTWPNPVHDILHYSVKRNGINYPFVIYDIKGCEVYHTSLDYSKNTIDLSFLEAGVYFYTSDFIRFQKIIKM